ncbi:hypothetical protein BG004_006849 [Podila humilis]|nr:hypothetical protein BG004_006849 [Podila humilis]
MSTQDHPPDTPAPAPLSARASSNSRTPSTTAVNAVDESLHQISVSTTLAVWSLRIPMATVICINLLFLFASFAMSPDDRSKSMNTDGTASNYPMNSTHAAIRIAQIATNIFAFAYCFWDHPRFWKARPPKGRHIASVGLLILYVYFAMLGAYRLHRVELDTGARIMDWVEEAMNIFMIILLVLEIRVQRQLQTKEHQQQLLQETAERVSPRVIFYQPNLSQQLGFSTDQASEEVLPKYERLGPSDEAAAQTRGQPALVIIDMTNLNGEQSRGASPMYEAGTNTVVQNSPTPTMPVQLPPAHLPPEYN